MTSHNVRPDESLPTLGFHEDIMTAQLTVEQLTAWRAPSFTHHGQNRQRCVMSYEGTKTAVPFQMHKTP